MGVDGIRPYQPPVQPASHNHRQRDRRKAPPDERNQSPRKGRREDDHHVDERA